MPKRFNGSVPRPQSRRFRVSVPDADESVLAWIGAQSDLSASVRSLIREAIERHGYRDATCYPVTQQPRRGRPPKITEQTELTEQTSQSFEAIMAAIDSPGLPDSVAPVAQIEPDVPSLPAALPASVPESVAGDASDDFTDDTDPTDGTDDSMAGNIEDMLGALR